NQGQSDPRVKFLARGNKYGLFLTADEAVLEFKHSGLSTQSSNAVSVIRMHFAGTGSSGSVSGVDELPGKSNYLIGNDPAKWHRNVPQFSRVRYQNVYPGIDLIYYGNHGRLEYDFEVAPGADPKQVSLRFHGPDKIRLNNTGDLVLATSGGEVRLESPRVYQQIGDEQHPVAGRVALRGEDEVGFELGSYDPSRVLTICPVLTSSGFLGGSGDGGCTAITGVTTSGCPAVAVDPIFNVYVAGSTTSTDFPLSPSGTPFQSTLAGTANLFVTKFAPPSS